MSDSMEINLLFATLLHSIDRMHAIEADYGCGFYTLDSWCHHYTRTKTLSARIQQLSRAQLNGMSIPTDPQ